MGKQRAVHEENGRAARRARGRRRQTGQRMKTMSATIQIDAPPEAVWAVLTDLGRYPEWNPLFREASGQVASGSRITLRTVHPANGRMMTVKPKITVADPDVELRWVSSLPGIISGEHRFTLTPAGGGTRLEQSETFRGLLAAFPLKTFTQADASFRALNEALKNRAERS
jgi:hypothetical protein